jgi:hypothetical protein
MSDESSFKYEESSFTDVVNFSSRVENKDDTKRFIRILTEAAAREQSAFVPASPLLTALAPLDDHAVFCSASQQESRSNDQRVSDDVSASSVPHWPQVSAFLKNHPNFLASYEHFFPNISESGAAVETATIVLLAGKRLHAHSIPTPHKPARYHHVLFPEALLSFAHTCSTTPQPLNTPPPSHPGTALSALCSTAVGAGGPPRIMAYHYLDLTKGAMRGLCWVFYLGTLLSLSEIAHNPVTNALVMEETWL